MKILFKIICVLMLGYGLIGCMESTKLFIDNPKTAFDISVTIISVLIPAILTTLCGLLGLMNKNAHLLLVLGMLAIMLRYMISYKGYNGIVPIVNYKSLFFPAAYIIIIMFNNSHEIIDE